MVLCPVSDLSLGFKSRTQSAIVVAVVMVVLLGCARKEELGSNEPQIQDLPVTAVVQKKLFRIDQLPGEIEAYQDVAVYPKVPGFVKWIKVDRGSSVKKGQLMCGLFAPELMAQRNEAYSKAKAVKGELHETESKLASAKATLLEARAQLAGDDDTYERTKRASLVPGVVAPNDVVVLGEKVVADREKVKAWQENLRAAEDAVSALRDSLKAAYQATKNYQDIQDYLTITAPFDGYVTERNMHVGSFVGPLGKGAYPPIVRVQELDLLRIVTPVPEANVGGVLPGAPVEFTVSSYPGERFVGTVARIGNSLEQKTRTMPVELNYWNPGWRVLPGMFCEVYWPTRRPHPSLFVPPNAVDTTSTLSTFVCRVSHHEVEWVPVERGEMMGNLTEVFGNLKQGDLVALHATDALKPHTRVKPVLVGSKTADSLPAPRPGYHSQGVPISMPSQERLELQLPANRGKPMPF